MKRRFQFIRPIRVGFLLLFFSLLFTTGGRPALAQDPGKPVIGLVSTGGGITLTRDGAVSLEQVLANIRKNFPEAGATLDSVTLEITRLFDLNSKHFSSPEFLHIIHTVNRLIHEPRMAGVIVTQGTFTSEETAYFLHLLIHTDKPVVITNAFRPHGMMSNDGDKNLLDALSVVLSPEAPGKGVLIVSNQTINSAREVTLQSVRHGAFVSGIHGVLGVIEADGVNFYRTPSRRHTRNSQFDPDGLTSLPKVEILSAYYDADPALIQAAADLKDLKGIVIDGFTATGEPHRTQLAALVALANQGIPIVLTARSGADNRVVVKTENPFIEGDNLTPQKARILLQLSLRTTSDFQEIQRIFNQY